MQQATSQHPKPEQGGAISTEEVSPYLDADEGGESHQRSGFDHMEEVDIQQPEAAPQEEPKFWVLNRLTPLYIIFFLIIEAWLIAISVLHEQSFWILGPFLLVPYVCMLLYSGRFHKGVTNVNEVSLQYLWGTSVIVFAVAVVQTALAIPYILIARRVALLTDASMAIPNILYISCVVMPIPECVIIYMMIYWSNPKKANNKVFVINSMYLTLGYVAGQIGGLILALPTTGVNGYTVHITVWNLFLLYLLEFAFAGPVNLILAYGTGLQIVSGLEKGKGSFFQSVGPAWVVRSVFYTTLSFAFEYRTWLAWASLIVSTPVVWIIYVIWMKKIERTLPASYLRNVGYLHAFGYGVISQDDDDNLEQGNRAHEMVDVSVRR